MIATRLPHCEAAQSGLFNILSFSSERLRVVEGDRDL